MGRGVFIILTVVLVLTTYHPVTAQQFEGIIDIKLSTPAFDEDGGLESVIQRFYIKSPHIRIEVEGSASDVTVLVDNAKREIYVLDRSMKRYSKNTFDEYTEEEEIGNASMEFEMNKTGRTTTLRGYPAELIEFIALGDTRESFDRIEVWVTSQLGTLLNDLLVGMLGNEASKSSWQRALVDRRLFPLQTRTYYDEYMLEETQVLKIERQSLKQDLFAIPPDYRHVDHRK